MNKPRIHKKKDVSEPDAKTIVRDFCSPNCYTTKNDICKCRCNSKFHGKGRQKTQENEKETAAR